MEKGLGGGHGRNGPAANVLYITLDNSIMFKGFNMLLTVGDSGGKRGLAGNTLGACSVTTRSANTNGKGTCRHGRRTEAYRKPQIATKKSFGEDANHAMTLRCLQSRSGSLG